MLKIKDNVDLKELEKFGFKYIEWRNAYVGGYTNRELWLSVDCVTKEIKMNEPFRDNDERENNIEILYDLIKADLVEKVGDRS